MQANFDEFPLSFLRIFVIMLRKVSDFSHKKFSVILIHWLIPGRTELICPQSLLVRNLLKTTGSQHIIKTTLGINDKYRNLEKFIEVRLHYGYSKIGVTTVLENCRKFDLIMTATDR